MLMGLKQMAETGSRSRRLNNVHIAFWVTVAVLGLVAAGRVLAGRHWARSLGAFVTAAIVFQILTLGQPPLLAGALLMVVAGWTLKRPSAPAIPEEHHDHAAVA